MPKPVYSFEEKKREGEAVKKAIENSGVKYSQESLMNDLGIAQSNMSQWFKGEARISDANLIFLGDYFNFNAMEIRPSLKKYQDYFIKIGLLNKLTPKNQESVLTIIRSLEGVKDGVSVTVEKASQPAKRGK